MENPIKMDDLGVLFFVEEWSREKSLTMKKVDSERIVEPQSRVFPLVVDFDMSPQVNPT